MTELPPFANDGVLPRGDHVLTPEALRNCHLVTGEGVQSTSWDSAWRAQLVASLEVLVHQLWEVGINQIFIDGSAELYPHLPGVPCGIQDRYGNDLEFPSAFRISRRGDLPKGIVRISR